MAVACHLALPLDEGAPDGGPGDAGEDGISSQRRTLLDDKLAGGGAPGWTFTPDTAHHAVTPNRMEIWTPSDMPPYYGTTQATRAFDQLPTGGGTVTALATFRWEQTSGTDDGATLSIGVVDLPETTLQVFQAQGQLAARFGTSLAAVEKGVWYKLRLTVDSSVSVRLYRASDLLTVLEAEVPTPASLPTLDSVRFAVTTDHAGPEVRASLTDVFVVEDIPPGAAH